ncbi:MAG: endolytic transglycosylase MltG, partial [Alistipes sp.]|nr:endolytic transglycosylase MltG [Alistipes sp.]
VLNYDKNNYLYFCAKPEFDGTHNFARTLSEHNANSRRYNEALKRLKK